MPNSQKVLRDNVLTALGALCLDRDMREQYLLAVPSAPLIRQHGVLITNDEVADLEKIIPTTGTITDADIASIRVCPNRPCVYRTPAMETIIGAAVMDDTFRADMFGSLDPSFDPVAVAYNYDFSLKPDDETLLRHLLKDKDRRAEIFQALESLGTKIKKSCKTDFVLKHKAAQPAA